MILTYGKAIMLIRNT